MDFSCIRSILRKYSIYFYGIFFFLSGCDTPLDSTKFDLTHWKNDKLACENFRQTSLSDFKKLIQPHLIDLSEKQLVNYLGAPDFRELYKRNQKFYYYQLEKTVACQSKTQSKILQKNTLYVVVRMNALNKVSSVTISKP